MVVAITEKILSELDQKEANLLNAFRRNNYKYNSRRCVLVFSYNQHVAVSHRS